MRINMEEAKKRVSYGHYKKETKTDSIGDYIYFTHTGAKKN